ncbi:hypothetical protein F5880DRAFT_1652253 [Lentinula raphanica]|nr:hypothetical protein F5880DRAFT_1652253 [Lentinula raphanica]
MGECWQLLSIDNWATTGHELGKLKEFFWCPNHALSFLKAVVMPSTYKSDTRSPEDQARAQRMALEPQSSTLLLTLPVELLLIIAEDLGKDYLHLLCFSLTCTFLWEITGRTRYHSLYRRLKQDSWSGSCIILIGEYADRLPDSMLTDEEKEEFKLLDERRYSLYGLAGSLYSIAYDNFRQLSRIPKYPIFGDQRVRRNPKLLDELMDAHDIEQCMPWVSVNRKDCVVERQDGDRWMLRNLSKREYVTLANSRHVMQILYTLVGETQYSCYSFSDEGPENWEGDRIDLTVASVHQQEVGDDVNEWADITRYVIKELVKRAYEDGCQEELAFEDGSEDESDPDSLY